MNGSNYRVTPINTAAPTPVGNGDVFMPESASDKKDTVNISKRKLYVLSSVFGVLTLLLLAGFVTFAALYFHAESKYRNGFYYNKRPPHLYNPPRGSPGDLPKWPGPSISPLGKYSTAGVAADNEICSQVGRDVMLRGGNAVDAAIASLFCIGIMDAHSAGIGGGHFMTIYNASSGQCSVVNARETAPAAATEDMYKDRYNESQIGWRAIAVPGELHGLWTEYKRFGGGVPWKTLIEPTIQLLKEGYPTSHALSSGLWTQRYYIKTEPTMRFFLNPVTNEPYRPGDQIKTRQNFAHFLEQIANAVDPVEFFYHGEAARRMISEIRAGGGILTEADFAGYRSLVQTGDEVMKVRLSNGRHICGPPPPSGAAVAMGILNVLDGYKYNLSSFDDTTQLYHHFIEASKFAYAGRSTLGDPAFVKNATDIARNLTTPEWAEWVRSKITDHAHPDAYYGGVFEGPRDHGTTHISVIDRDGNAVSVTSTINLVVGSLRASNAYGIVWNDEMDDFSSPGAPNYFDFPPSPANFIRPGKRPQSSMSPIIIYDENNEHNLLSIGGAGGSTIISGVAGVALHAMWLKDNIKQAVDAPRLHNQLQPNVTKYEVTFPKQYVDALSARGHDMQLVHNITVVTAVERLADRQIYANSDFRKGDESGPAGF